MANKPIPFIILFLLLKHLGSGSTPVSVPLSLNSLQLESLIDNLHTMIHAMEKLNSFTHSDLASSLPESLPDMKKILEVVEKLPL